MAIDTGNFLAMQALSQLQAMFDEPALEHAERVRAMLAERIAAAGGAISFGEFMHHALYAPQLGYYTSGMRNFGPAGDFVTAPEVSDVFGRVLARQIAEIHAVTKTSDVFEIGAGSGALAKSILTHFVEAGRGVNYAILEASPDHAERQRAELMPLAQTKGVEISWLNDLPAVPVDGVILANEVLDALPVERFRIAAAGPEQYVVITDEAGFSFRTRPAPGPLGRAIADIQTSLGTMLPAGYQSEVSLALGPWVTDIAAALGRGLLLFSDYGYSRRDYYAPERHNGTLLCHLRHQAHADPLIVPGMQDITAWVDFTAVAEAGTGAGLELAGFTPQAQFLMAVGLADELATPMPGTAAQLRRAAEIKTLTLPGEMGERFRFMGFTRGIIGRVAGFSATDLRHTL